jgi:hypothetical protein
MHRLWVVLTFGVPLLLLRRAAVRFARTACWGHPALSSCVPYVVTACVPRGTGRSGGRRVEGLDTPAACGEGAKGQRNA